MHFSPGLVGFFKVPPRLQTGHAQNSLTFLSQMEKMEPHEVKNTAAGRIAVSGVVEEERFLHKTEAPTLGGAVRAECLQSVLCPQSLSSIRVEALALNFFDVVRRLGIMPSCVAGRSLEVSCSNSYDFAGRNEEDLFGMGAPCGNRIDFIPLSALRPRSLSALEAAALPTVSLTVSMAFDFAQLTHGEVVLIQAGAGGVGLAAIAAARQLGAHPVCTAGSAKKFWHLRSKGILHVTSSRDGLAFLYDFL